MAEIILCPKCNQKNECQKKGKNAAGEQVYLCKGCGKRFILAASKKSVKKTTTAKTTSTKSINTSVKTIVKVNSNVIKEVSGKSLNVEQAFKLVAPYFQEVLKDKVTINTIGDVTTIEFKIQTGSKG